MTTTAPDRRPDRPILVTGGIRFGTTWVGRILEASGEVGYIMEPFNLSHRAGICAVDWRYQYTYLTPENEAEILGPLRDTLGFRYRLGAQLRSIRSVRNLGGTIRDLARTNYWRWIRRPRPLLKDPVALFSAHGLATRIPMDVVVLMRHPAAFAWSYRRIGEPNRFADLARQPRLLDELLGPFADEIRIAADGGIDRMREATLMWNLFAHTIRRHASRNPEWTVVTHESLSLDPETGFRELYRRLGLTYSDAANTRVQRLTSPRNPTEAPTGVRHQLRRDSRANVKTWKQRLTPREVQEIRLQTEARASHFYPEESWT